MADWTHLFPALNWLPAYRRAWLWSDVMAGRAAQLLLIKEHVATAAPQERQHS